jgi:hypothetical protein
MNSVVNPFSFEITTGGVITWSDKLTTLDFLGFLDLDDMD